MPNTNVPVDISYEALKYLGSIGYSRVKFLKSEITHRTPDICDKVAGRFTGNRFATLSSVLKGAPVFGSNPPAPIYGLTHPACRCSYMVYPPNSISHLRLPGNPNPQQKREILSMMYPQQIWALSKVPTVKDIDFSAFVDVPVKRPAPDQTLMQEQPWYQQAWNWVKGKIFRQASNYADFVRYAHERYADNNLRLGDLVKFIADDSFVSEFRIETPFPQDFIGLALADRNEREIFMYVAPYDSVFPVRKDKLVRISNADVPHELLCKKVRLFNEDIQDHIEGIVCGHMEDHILAYDFIAGGMQRIPLDQVHLLD